jgi:hypothetical protein
MLREAMTLGRKTQPRTPATKSSNGVLSCRPDFFQKEALRQERRRAYCLK